MCRVSCRLKVSRATSRPQDGQCRRNGKVLTRKTSWALRAQDAAATKVGNESGTLYQTATKAAWLSRVCFPRPLRESTSCRGSIFSPVKRELLSLENNLVCCGGLLFIISHQLSLGSDLCDLEFGCRTDFIFKQKEVDPEGAEPGREGLCCCVASEEHSLSIFYR